MKRLLLPILAVLGMLFMLGAPTAGAATLSSSSRAAPFVAADTAGCSWVITVKAIPSYDKVAQYIVNQTKTLCHGVTKVEYTMSVQHLQGETWVTDGDSVTTPGWTNPSGGYSNAYALHFCTGANRWHYRAMTKVECYVPGYGWIVLTHANLVSYTITAYC